MVTDFLQLKRLDTSIRKQIDNTVQQDFYICEWIVLSFSCREIMVHISRWMCIQS